MGIPFGTSGNFSIPAIPVIAAQAAASSPQPSPVATASRSVLVAANLGQSLLMPASASPTKLMPLSLLPTNVEIIRVARKAIPPARFTGPDREEKKRGEFLRKVKISKSEAAGQQTQQGR